MSLAQVLVSVGMKKQKKLEGEFMLYVFLSVSVGVVLSPVPVHVPWMGHGHHQMSG